MLKRKRRKKIFDAIILTIDCLTLTKSTDELAAAAEKMAFPLQTLLARRPVPIVIVVTQCDHFGGFLDFFSDLESEERQQSFAIFLLDNQNNLPFREFMKERLIAFINRISERLLWRLHHEQNLTRRIQIKDFPIQLEKITENLEHWLDKLLIDKTSLSGIYFTSSQQTGNG